ncbi:MAG TPA: glycoside hydrolase [Clostridiaceae bacterium]|nr:glycoside hydrolase [Clostridiaceae bacterium]
MKRTYIFRVFFLILTAFILLAAPVRTMAETSSATGKFNMSYIYFGDPSMYKYYVNRTNGSLDVVSPNYFDLYDNGTLKLTNSLSTDFINEMHKMGVKVVPFLSNHWDRNKGKKALENRAVLAQQIADAVKKYNLDGVNVDIENVTENERDIYTDFVRILRSKLPSNKEVSVAVAPNPYNATKGWQGSYDYASLAKYSDYLMIMAYDEHYQGGAPGPVASAGFVEASIKYALQRVPKEKIVLGIPFYGRYWKNGTSYGGYGINAEHVERLIAKYNGYVIFDETYKSPKAIITIKPGDEPHYVLGRKLDTGTYTIWYENEESIMYKLSLVQKYDLKGTGSWSLGQENPAIWPHYDLWLNGHYFIDAGNHWAKDAILFVKEKGWMIGVPGNRFAPENPLTRAEAAAILVRAFCLEKTGDDGMVFTDTINHWAKEEIDIARQNNVVSGIGNGMFLPDKPVTRQEMAVMLDNILMLPELDSNGNNPYYDISAEKNPWSYKSIIKMTCYGIFNGGVDGGFHPDDNTTRAQMAVLMKRIAER